MSQLHCSSFFVVLLEYFWLHSLHPYFNTQKESFEDVLQNECPYKLCNIHRKTPVLESVFNIIAGLKGCRFIEKRLQHRRFPVNIVKLLRTFFFVEHLRWLLLNSFYSKYYPLIRINAIYAMNISAQIAMTREIFPRWEADLGLLQP